MKIRPPATTRPTIGEMISEAKIPITFGMLSASTTEVPFISALVKPIPIMAPISVWELDAGRPKYQVPRFQIIAASNMENTMARPCDDPILSSRSVGSICTMAYATLRPPSKTPKKLNTAAMTTANCERIARV